MVYRGIKKSYNKVFTVAPSVSMVSLNGGGGKPQGACNIDTIEEGERTGTR